VGFGGFVRFERGLTDGDKIATGGLKALVRKVLLIFRFFRVTPFQRRNYARTHRLCTHA
jgi:hypothetical protein